MNLSQLIADGLIWSLMLLILAGPLLFLSGVARGLRRPYAERVLRWMAWAVAGLLALGFVSSRLT